MGKKCRSLEKSIHGVLLNLLPILSMPLMSALGGSMVDFSGKLQSVHPEEIVAFSESSASGTVAAPDPFPKYPGLERFVEPYGVKVDKIQKILRDFKTGLPPGEKKKLARLIYEESLEYQYEPELILAVIVAESSFYNWSRSTMGAIGLMQIKPTTGFSLAKTQNINWMGNVTLFDPYLNIKLGIKYLAMMHDQFDDLQIALMAYNYGPTSVREMIKRCDRLPRAYSQKVMSTYRRFMDLETRDVVNS